MVNSLARRQNDAAFLFLRWDQEEQMSEPEVKGTLLIIAAAVFYYAGVGCKKIWRPVSFAVAAFIEGFENG